MSCEVSSGYHGVAVVERIYIKQLLAGRDFARPDPFATQMVNFVYLLGDRQTRECLIVDPAWDVVGIVAAASADDMTVTGVLATHYHPDHIGGDLFGHVVEGLAELKDQIDVPVHVHRAEAEGVRVMTGLSTADLVLHDGDDVVMAGEVPIRMLHTPGHTPGSQCFLVGDEALVSGDTLFVQGCGRVDLPGGDSDEMYRTLTQRLATLRDEIVLFPGHDYGGAPTATLADLRRTHAYLTVDSLEAWRRLMG